MKIDRLHATSAEPAALFGAQAFPQIGAITSGPASPLTCWPYARSCNNRQARSCKSPEYTLDLQEKNRSDSVIQISVLKNSWIYVKPTRLRGTQAQDMKTPSPLRGMTASMLAQGLATHQAKGLAVKRIVRLRG